MRNVFNFARFCVYLAIIAWTVVVLAIAAHFEQMLVASDLTRFVPLAIFISVITLLVIGALLMAPHVLRHNYVTTKIEVALLALLAVFWITLGAYTAAVEIGEVECFADEDETEPIEVQGFTTEEYQAQYRALEGFSIINAFLLLGFTLFVLLLSWLQTQKGLSAWSTPMPLFPWLSRRHGRHNSTKLPAPVTSKEPKAVPPMATKASAPMASKAAAPARAATRPPAAPVRTKSQPAPVAPPRAPARAYTAPAPLPKSTATGAKLTPAVPRPSVQRSATMAAATAAAARADLPRPTPYRSATMAAASKPKTYSSQYQRPAAAIPQTKTGVAGQSYQYYTGAKMPAPPPAAAARGASRPSAAAAPPKRR